MTEKLTICIDSIKKNRDSLIINGWAFDSETKQPVTISVGSPYEKQGTITPIHRSDVTMVHKLSASAQVGFQVVVTKSDKQKVPLVFANAEGVSQTEWIDPNQAEKEKSSTSLSRFAARSKKGLRYLQRNGLKNTLRRLKIDQQKNDPSIYQAWIKENEQWSEEAIDAEIATFDYLPTISILMPVYNVEEKWLRKCIESVQNQYYPHWELCMADDASTDPNVKKLLDQYVAKDERIKVVYRETNGHISAATNSALAIATGEFAALLDNDDELAPIAFYSVVKLLNQNPELDLIYSDEDKIDMEGNRFDPAFKPEWSPDLLLGTNYISHLGVYRRSILEEIGGFRIGYEGAQDYDLVLRFTEKTMGDRIAHIPEILYYWRILPTSTAADQSTKGYAFEAGLKAVQDALTRRGIAGTATHAAGNGLYDVHYDLLTEALVSIIIPTRNGYDDMKRCLESIVTKTTYPNFEVIIADNGSTEERMFDLYEQYKQRLNGRLYVERIDIPFNYSRINNLAAQTARGEYVLFLNNDTEVITPDWITQMVSFTQFDRIGCVGAKLYYPNHTIQHAGVVLGLGGAAGHPHHTYPQGDFGYFGKLEINVDYSAVTAACLMTKKTDFDQVGGFNEELTVAFNDVDLCLKIQALGKNNVWLHGVELYHFESQSRGYENTPEKQARFELETAYMEKTWGNLIDNDPYYNPHLTRTGGNFAIRQ